MTTDYHAKLFAHELTKAGGQGLDRITQSLFNASVDLNPHQVEAALFALRSPLSKGVMLADEVGLGKTIEAALVLCQFWAERKRSLLVVCPAALRKQWQMELEEKFNLPSLILDSKAFREEQKAGRSNPFSQRNAIVIASYHYVSKMAVDVRKVQWDLVVIDEAHKLRNSHQSSNVIGQNLRWALQDRRKILLTATPLQNSLTELYGISTLIDENLFGDLPTFRSLYANTDGDLDDLRSRLSGFCRRTLRRDVMEFVRYTERRLLTIPFNPTNDEHAFYEAVSRFLQRGDTYAFPKKQRHLMILIVRKLLASSPVALQGTLEAIRSRLVAMLENRPDATLPSPSDCLLEEEALDEYVEELMEVAEEELPGYGDLDASSDDEPPPVLDRRKLKSEIDELDRFINWSRGMGTDTKTTHLLKALDTGWAKMRELRAEEKVVVFTESRRSMEYLRTFLEANGYAGDVICFSGGGKRDADAEKIYEEYMAENRHNSDVNTAGSKAVMLRHALIDRFRRKAKILIATEAGAEGINLQFCSMVVNFDLPWNPQRIEQRIGRCHRYGQKHDVVVINFLNQRNAADQRVYELLEHKFRLFDGVFGASDDVLGRIDNSTGFELKILQLYQQCRTEEEIQTSFDKLQAELEDSIAERLEQVKRQVLENFDEDVQKRLKFDYADALHTLDEYGRKFWLVTKTVLADSAEFDDKGLSFKLTSSPFPGVELGEYYLKPKTDVRDSAVSEDTADAGRVIYRLNSPLGEGCINWAKGLDAPCREVVFDLSGYGAKITVLEALKGKSGYLLLNLLTVNSLDKEEYLLFSGSLDEGNNIPHDIIAQFFKLDGVVGESCQMSDRALTALQKDMACFAQAKLHESLETNNQFFVEQNDKLDRWVEDCVKAAERDLEQTMGKIRDVRHRINLSETLEEQAALQEELGALERTKREGRNRIFDVEDQASAKRDGIVKALKRKLVQNTQNNPLFVIRWKIV